MREYGAKRYAANRERLLAESKARSSNTDAKGAKRLYDKRRRSEKGDELRAYDAGRYAARKFGTPLALWSRARKRASKNGLDFNITVEDVSIPETCPVLGIPLFCKKGRGGGDHSPSLDRIDPLAGYVRGNVVVISNLANRIKSNASVTQIEMVAKWLRESCPSPHRL